MKFATILIILPVVTLATCPFLAKNRDAASKQDLIPPHPLPSKEDDAYVAALNDLPLEEVKDDLKSLFHNSQEWWPADYGNYGPFFIRLAWHCSGSYRGSDGRGGCDGGRQRFDPEQSWDDNTNLDKARQLLWPIKEKYGLGLSWGDLFILAGTTAIEDMGGPVIGFCAGRRDDPDGTNSLPLGPSPEQEALAPCETNGQCEPPLGTTTVGLIYVNPEGPMGQPIPEQSAPQIRDTFKRMGMNDSETVALIGGGHAFGKAHGACPDGAGPSPGEDPENPWPGNCGTGKGADTFTSGFEGPWTSNPTSWDNSYFKYLVEFDWQKEVGPGGHYQWAPHGDNAPEGVMMLTSDVSLLYDDTYREIVQQYAADQALLDSQFSHAWYKLTTRDMGPVTRYVGSAVPPAQPFQYPLPDPLPEDQLADFDKVRSVLGYLIHSPQPNVLRFDDYAGASYGPLFVRLAWQCANTFRTTDYMGGCNGARIRMSPQREWPANVMLDKALQLLKPVKESFGEGLSWADLIVLAGTVSLEDAAAQALSAAGFKEDRLMIPFTGGRVDAPMEESETNPTPAYLESRLQGGSDSDTIDIMTDVMTVLGLTTREAVALVGGGHSLGQMHKDRSGFQDGSWTEQPAFLNTEWFHNVLNLNYTSIGDSSKGTQEYVAQKTTAVTGESAQLYMLKTDMIIKFHPEYKAIAQQYAENSESFYTDFVQAWVKVMNADLFNEEYSKV